MRAQIENFEVWKKELSSISCINSILAQKMSVLHFTSFNFFVCPHHSFVEGWQPYSTLDCSQKSRNLFRSFTLKDNFDGSRSSTTGMMNTGLMFKTILQHWLRFHHLVWKTMPAIAFLHQNLVPTTNYFNGDLSLLVKKLLMLSRNAKAAFSFFFPLQTQLFFVPISTNCNRRNLSFLIRRNLLFFSLLSRRREKSSVPFFYSTNLFSAKKIKKRLESGKRHFPLKPSWRIRLSFLHFFVAVANFVQIWRREKVEQHVSRFFLQQT